MAKKKRNNNNKPNNQKDQQNNNNNNNNVNNNSTINVQIDPQTREDFLELRKQYQAINKPLNSKERKRLFNYTKQTLKAAYDRDDATTFNKEENRKKTEEELKGTVTSKNQYISYSKQSEHYIRFLADNYHIKDLTQAKRWMFKDYIEEQLDKFETRLEKMHNGEKTNYKEDGYMLTSLNSQISAVVKLNDALEKQDMEKHNGSKKTYKLISEEQIRGNRKKGIPSVFKQRDLSRDLEDVMQSTQLVVKEPGKIGYSADKEAFEKIANILGEQNPEFERLWRFIGATGMRLNSALNVKKQDITPNSAKIEVGKKGKKYTAENMVDEYYLTAFVNDLGKDFSSGSRVFVNFRKKDGSEMKQSTVKSMFQKAVKAAGEQIGIEGVTPHSGRKYFCQSGYSDLLSKKPEDFMNFITQNFDKYKDAFNNHIKQLNNNKRYNTKQYRSGNGAPSLSEMQAQGYKLFKGFDKPEDVVEYFNKFVKNADKKTKRYTDEVSAYLTIEEMSALVMSVESGHQRMSIMAAYIRRLTAGKVHGAKVQEYVKGFAERNFK